jgi:protein O-mannosyl-transferase
VLLAALCLTLLVYWPALHGGYLFDDGVYFVDNPDIHVSTLDAGDWYRAAVAQSGINLLVRPLSSLTFAANYYFTGLDPFGPKLTNVAIHLLNGLLLFFLLRELFRWRDLTVGAIATRNPDAVAAVLAGAWLLLPINLTGVAYVAQRMEALATLFVLAGLWRYVRVRRRQYARNEGGVRAGLIIALFTVLGLGAKEDAALLPLYTACIEFALSGFRERNGRASRTAIWTHLLLLVVPFVAGLLWMSAWAFHGVENFRTFTIAERLLTESRVLIQYIQWTLLPRLNVLTFYHDDLPISHGLLDPPATLASIAALLLLLAAAIWQRKSRPLFCLGILWFFAGHSMTATIIPLELVFEHRNYFPSIGLLLAVASLLALEPGIRARAVVVVIAAGLIVLYAFTTFLRAREWSNPLQLAYSEALKRPESSRAQYELARTLIIFAGKDEGSPLLAQARSVLERYAQRPDSGITALQALIYIDGRAHRDIDPRWWQAIVARLKTSTPSQSDVEAVIFLFHCQMDGDCPRQEQELFDVFVAALERSGGNLNLKSAYADFALRELGDAELAVRMSREVVSSSPHIAAYRANLIRILISTGQFDAAESELAELATQARLGSLDELLAKLRSELAAAKSSAAPDSTDDAMPTPGPAR